nr:protein ABHD17B [Ipomoea batatas]GME19647.1 protein ABHD17B [Ipomoea batatas]
MSFYSVLLSLLFQTCRGEASLAFILGGGFNLNGECDGRTWPPSGSTGVTAEKNVDVHLLDTRTRLWPPSGSTLLPDLGQMQALFLELRAHFRVKIMSYDYSGYGGSSGKPSEFNTCYDIEAVYNCLKSEYGIKQEDVILIKTRTATALSLALPTNGAFAAVAVLFQYRVVRAYDDDDAETGVFYSKHSIGIKVERVKRGE